MLDIYAAINASRKAGGKGTFTVKAVPTVQGLGNIKYDGAPEGGTSDAELARLAGRCKATVAVKGIVTEDGREGNANLPLTAATAHVLYGVTLVDDKAAEKAAKAAEKAAKAAADAAAAGRGGIDPALAGATNGNGTTA